MSSSSNPTAKAAGSSSLSDLEKINFNLTTSSMPSASSFFSTNLTTEAPTTTPTPTALSTLAQPRDSNDDDDDDANSNAQNSFRVFSAVQNALDENAYRDTFAELNLLGTSKPTSNLSSSTNNDPIASLASLLPKPTVASDGSVIETQAIDQWSALDNQIKAIEETTKKQDAIELHNMISSIGQAIEAKTTISLPSQSAASIAFSESIAKMSQKDGLMQGKTQSKKQKLRSQVAANKAQDRFERFELNSTASNNRGGRTVGGDEPEGSWLGSTGNYRKSLQQQKKKQRRKLDW